MTSSKRLIEPEDIDNSSNRKRGLFLGILFVCMGLYLILNIGNTLHVDPSTLYRGQWLWKSRPLQIIFGIIYTFLGVALINFFTFKKHK